LRGFQSRTRDYALKLLSYRGRSERELAERLLRKGITESETSSLILYLKEIGLVDDMSLSEALKRETLTSRRLSQNGAKRFMLKRGIPSEIVDLVFSSHEDTDFDNAVHIVKKKLKVLGNYPQPVARRRLYNFLLRRGYSSETIRKVFRDTNLREGD
jgi:regulatory protein